MPIKRLHIAAGKKVRELLLDRSLRKDDIGTLAGASGGPKWLVLAGIDRAIPEFFSGRTQPLLCVGSSIGAWRMAAFAGINPGQACSRFKEEYICQRYSANPTHTEVTSVSDAILNAYVSDADAVHIADHPFMRLCVITAASRGLCASDGKLPLSLGLGAAASLNVLSRRFTTVLFPRVVFNDKRYMQSRNLFHGRCVLVPLSAANVRPAILASGSIPLVMSGIRGVPGAGDRVLRDGGIVDYHLDIDFPSAGGGIVLYPHFFSRVIPGWFDKGLPWRKPHAHNFDNVLLVAPSREFTESLPMKKIPDRGDFKLFRGDDAGRIRYWNIVVERSEELAADFFEAFESNTLRDFIRP